jgi:hypothetical protein
MLFLHRGRVISFRLLCPLSNPILALEDRDSKSGAAIQPFHSPHMLKRKADLLSCHDEVL